MQNTKYIVKSVLQDIINENLSLKALIQEINSCTSPEELTELNHNGRAKISVLKSYIEKLDILAKECVDVNERKDITEEVKNNRDQMTSSWAAFCTANVNASLAIDKANKKELFSSVDEDSKMRQRLKKDKASLVKMSSNVTEQLLSISRQLADTSQQSSDTLDVLVSSSGSVKNTHNELGNTNSVIKQSGELLAKYGRREFSDKLILLFAFGFFVFCVGYIIQKRLF